jgi:hypothetical protein
VRARVEQALKATLEKEIEAAELVAGRPHDRTHDKSHSRTPRVVEEA